MPAWPERWTLAAPGLGVIAALALATWAMSLWRRDASLADRLWPVAIAAASCVHALGVPALTLRAEVLLALVLAWGARLAVYITRRNWGHGEDRRYAQMRAQWPEHFGLYSLVVVFGLQALLAWCVSAPVLVGVWGGRPWGGLDTAGLALALFGGVFEAVADAQMARFKADPAQAGQVMDRGLWRYSRHPNYFGEACFWWGIGLLALGAAGLAGAWGLVSPLLMTWLLLKVSGVRLLEHDIGERRPAYRDYTRRTRAFVPGRPKD
jgi:steroid 5-alpha reductase family enzyme